MSTEVTSLELCKELYELSGWDGTLLRRITGDDHKRRFDADLVVHTVYEKVVGVYDAAVGCDECEGVYTDKTFPAYDLGYLLRKLPSVLGEGTNNVRDLHVAKAPDNYIADYMYRVPKNGRLWWHMYDRAPLTEADTPEDAACKLAIELFKQGVLTKEQS